MPRAPVSDGVQGDPGEEFWKGILLGTDPRLAGARSRLKHVPSEPRCKLCGAPFGGVGAPFMRFLGRDRWAKNPCLPIRRSPSNDT